MSEKLEGSEQSKCLPGPWRTWPDWNRPARSAWITQEDSLVMFLEGDGRGITAEDARRLAAKLIARADELEGGSS